MKKSRDNKGSNVKGALMGFFLMFCILAVIFGWVYDIGVNRPPLKYANISDSVLDFLRDLNKKDPGLGFVVSDQGPYHWDNDADLGQTSTAGKPWVYEEDANFIVYYHRDNDALWQGYAQEVLKMANEAIISLTDLMGTYFYPADVNGRKLPIYLAETEQVYNSTINELMENNTGNHSGSLGITIISIGRTGCMTKGIVLHPICFETEPYGINGYNKVLLHEMNHYVFFTALDYGKDVDHYMWVSEGLAEYYCKRHEGKWVNGMDSISFLSNNCFLTEDFPLETNVAYWGGESFYQMLEHKLTKKGVRRWIQYTYEYSTDSTFFNMNLDPDSFKQEWIQTLVAGSDSMPE